MAHAKAPAIVKDELQNLLRGLAKGLFSQLSGWKIACDGLETP